MKKTAKQWLPLLVLTLLLSMPLAFAETAEQNPAPETAAPQAVEAAPQSRTFEDLDKNQDGLVSREEFMANWLPCAPARFDNLDIDKDGFLSKEELAACAYCGGTPQGGRGLRGGRGPMGPGGGYGLGAGGGYGRGQGQGMGRGQGWGQGRGQGRGQGMGRGQGWGQGRGQGPGQGQGWGAGRGRGMGGRGRTAATDRPWAGRRVVDTPPAEAGAAPRAPMPAARPTMQNIDADQDGKISREEYEAAWKQFHKEQFDRLDVNKDGSLSADELPRRFAPVAP